MVPRKYKNGIDIFERNYFKEQSSCMNYLPLQGLVRFLQVIIIVRIPPPQKKNKKKKKPTKTTTTPQKDRKFKLLIYETKLNLFHCFPFARERDVAPWYERSLMVRSFMVDPLSYFSFQPVLHDWYNNGRGMCYPVCGMMHIKEPLLLIGKSGGSGFPLLLSVWSFTICPAPYIRK